MGDDRVVLVRLPIDTNCSDCKNKLPFGVWAYWCEPTAICVDCGTKRGWSSKDRAKDIIKKLELQEDIKALKKQRKIDSDALLLLKEQIDIHKMAECGQVLEKKIEETNGRVEEYLLKVGTADERKALQQVQASNREGLDQLKALREIIQNRIFMLDRTEVKWKKKRLIPTPLEEEE